MSSANVPLYVVQVHFSVFELDSKNCCIWYIFVRIGERLGVWVDRNTNAFQDRFLDSYSFEKLFSIVVYVPNVNCSDFRTGLHLIQYRLDSSGVFFR